MISKTWQYNKLSVVQTEQQQKKEKKDHFIVSCPRLERTIEDHESIMEIISSWGMDEDNRIHFRKNYAKYELFRKPLVSLPHFPSESTSPLQIWTTRRNSRRTSSLTTWCPSPAKTTGCWITLNLWRYRLSTLVSHLLLFFFWGGVGQMNHLRDIGHDSGRHITWSGLYGISVHFNVDFTAVKFNPQRDAKPRRRSSSFHEQKKKKMSFSHPQTFLSSSTCPEIHGHLHAKEPSKKSWKKLYFILRRSGLYVSSKGTSKVSVSDVNGDNADFYYVSPQRRRWFFSIIIPLLLPHERFLIFWFICVALQGQQKKIQNLRMPGIIITHA